MTQYYIILYIYLYSTIFITCIENKENSGLRFTLQILFNDLVEIPLFYSKILIFVWVLFHKCSNLLAFNVLLYSYYYYFFLHWNQFQLLNWYDISFPSPIGSLTRKGTKEQFSVYFNMKNRHWGPFPMTMSRHLAEIKSTWSIKSDKQNLHAILITLIKTKNHRCHA